MKVKRHVELEETYMKNIYKHLPSTLNISYILNELLFHLDMALAETKPNLDDIFKKSIQSALVNLTSVISTENREE